MMTNDHYLYACLFTRFVFLCNIDYNRIMTTTTTTTTTSTSSNLPDKDQIRVHVRRDNVLMDVFGDNYVNMMVEKNVKHSLLIEVFVLDIIIKHQV
jgi:hypothetical protein